MSCDRDGVMEKRNQKLSHMPSLTQDMRAQNGEDPCEIEICQTVTKQAGDPVNFEMTLLQIVCLSFCQICFCHIIIIY